MDSVQTHPSLQTGILKHLAEWRSNRAFSPLSSILSPDVKAALLEQDSIGWWNFLLGRVSSKFATVQQAYYLSGQSKRGGRTWLSALMRETIDISFDMWEHRNNILHNTMTPRAQAELALLHQRVLDEYAKGTSTLLPQDHHWLGDKDDSLSMDLERTKTWLFTVSVARQAYRAHARQLHEKHRLARDFMKNWLNGEAWRNRRPPNAADSGQPQ